MAKSEFIRLNRYIAASGVCSRRKADNLIDQGLVYVNGKKVFELGMKIDPENDSVTVDGKLIKPSKAGVYLMFNKPKRVMTTMNDPEGRPCVGEYFADYGERVFPVGRLDWDSEGLLIMTNDGDFANQVTHPKFEIPKTYLAKVDQKVEIAKLNRLLVGVPIIGGRVKAKEVEIEKASGQYDWVRIVITEGKTHQVRQMLAKIGYDVIKLKRVQIGQLKLGEIPSGDYIELSNKQLERIFQKEKEAPAKMSSEKKKRTNDSARRIEQSRGDQKRGEWKQGYRGKGAKKSASKSSSRNSSRR